MLVDRDGEVARLSAALAAPTLVVVSGLPGIGKTAVARAGVDRSGRRIAAAGGLPTLRERAGIALAAAIRADVPTDDPALAVEAVRARVGDGVLLLDDLQWADDFTVSLLPRLADQVRVVVALRTPAPLLGAAVDVLHGAASVWLEPRPLDPAALTAIAGAARPGIDPAEAATLAERSGGNPGVLTALAAAAFAPAGGRTAGSGDAVGVVPAAGLPGLDGIAALLAELTQPERTALAALGLLGRPARRELLGAGAEALLARGLIESAEPVAGSAAAGSGAGSAANSGARLRPVDRLIAEVAAGILPADQRAAMHRRIADLVGHDGEAARHLAAAGEHEPAAARALLAADRASSISTRAGYLALAAAQAPTDPVIRAAAVAAAADGRPGDGAGLLATLSRPDDTDRILAATWRAGLYLASGASEPAIAELAGVRAAADQAPSAVRCSYLAALVRTTAAVDPPRAASLGAELVADRAVGSSPSVLMAYAAALRIAGDAEWDKPANAALELLEQAPVDGAAGSDSRQTAIGSLDSAGDQLTGSRWAVAAEFIGGLRASLRTTDAAAAADRWTARAADDASYGWEMTYRVEALWAHLHTDAGTGATIDAGTALAAHEVPPAVQPLLATTLGLALGDSGDIPAGRAALERSRVAHLPRWALAELQWLDGDSAGALALAAGVLAETLPGDPARPLAEVTAAWAGGTPAKVSPPIPILLVAAAESAPTQSLSTAPSPDPSPAPSLTPIPTPPPTPAPAPAPPPTPAPSPMPAASPMPAPAAATQRAFADQDWSGAARAWQGAMRREQVRCLIASAAGMADDDAVPVLREAERLTAEAGLDLLAGRARRELRRHGVTVVAPPARALAVDSHGLSRREREVIDLAAAGQPSRRIAERLGLTPHTVESYVKSAMIKLGARTRTEATILARRRTS